LLIKILQRAEVSDPEGAVYRALQCFKDLEAAEKHVDMLAAWQEKGGANAEQRVWKALEEARK